MLEIFAEPWMVAYFTKRSFTFSDFKMAGMGFSLFLFSVGMLGKMMFLNNPKKQAWFITLVASFIMTVIGIIYLLVKVPMYNNLFAYGDNGADVFHSTNDVTDMTMLFFALVNFFDLSFGVVFYRKYLGVMTAWFHHSLFTWMMFSGSTGNGLLFSMKPYGQSFLLMCIEELPTFTLALGSTFPMFRSDLGFGIPFFLLRICLHGYMTSYGYYMYFTGVEGVEMSIPILYSVALTMHVFWFKGWVESMRKKHRKEITHASFASRS